MTGSLSERDKTQNTPGSMARRFFGPEVFQGLVRPSLRPIGLLAASFAVAALVSVLITAVAPAATGGFIRDPFSAFAGGLAAKAISILVILLIARDDFGLHRLLSGRLEKWAIPVGVSLGAGMYVMENLIGADGSDLFAPFSALSRLDPAHVVLVAVSASLLAMSGALEELLFRGIIQCSCEAHFRPVSAIVFTAVIFAAPHAAAGWVAATELFVVGLALSWYRQKYGSLALPIAVHACHNLLYGLSLGLSA
ncbi:MAG: CPBP family intramembrane metalloprotease [Thermoanaerobaculales bacterium]|nr:CPBP family intramembrane metalloprotease [Thermoanaerobaculales bacterium]